MPPRSFETGAPPPPAYSMIGRGAPHPTMMNRGPPPRRFDGRQSLPPHQVRAAAAPFSEAALPPPSSMAFRAEMQAEMRARASLSPMSRQLPPQGFAQGLSPQQASFPPGSLAASIPLRESLLHNHNMREPSSPAGMSMENARAFKLAQAQVALAAAMPQRSPTKQASLQDAASALLTMGSIIKHTEDDTSTGSREESVDEGDEKSARAAKPFPTRLALPEDEEKLNSMHCFLRAELLEVFLVEEEKAKNPPPPVVSENSLEAELQHSPPPNSSPNRIGIRCVHCSRARKIYGQECEAPMAVFYPKSLAELYRLVTSWQRVHLRKCRNLPKGVRETYQTLRQTDKTRGKTHYWVTSAKKIGLKDSKRKAGGIVFAPYDEK